MTAYIWPVDPSTKGQGYGDNPGPPYNPVRGHTGDDFKVAPGTPVHAIGDGTVRAIGQLPEPYTSNPWWIEGQWAGNVVIIDHGPIVSVYAHLSEWHVNLGDTVTQGQVIALSGESGGASTGPHLHFEILPDGWDFNNGTYGRVNPAIYCTAIQEDDLANVSDEQLARLLAAADRINGVITDPTAKVLTVNDIPDIAKATVNCEVPWYGFDGKRPPEGQRRTTNLTAQLGWMDSATTSLAAAAKTVAPTVAPAVDVEALAAALAPKLNAGQAEAFITALRTQINK